MSRLVWKWNYYFGSHALQGITKMKGPTPASILPVFKLLCLNRRDQQREEGRSSRAERLQGSSHQKYLGLRSAVSATAHWQFRSALEIYAWHCADAVLQRKECERTRVRPPSRCHGDLVFITKPYFPLSVEMRIGRIWVACWNLFGIAHLGGWSRFLNVQVET